MISIIIPSYNGKHLLERTLGHNIALLSGNTSIEWIISDDASTDGSIQWLKSSFPDVKVVTSAINKGFGHTAHAGALAATGDILFFLNNDMKLIATDIDLVQTYLHDSDVFAVVPQIIRPSKNNALESITWGFFKGGWLSAESYVPDTADTSLPQSILWACGGAMWITHRRYFELGGFDPLFLPFYFEDLDLSYRAWQRGWKSLYVPQAGLVHHDHQATISSLFPKKKIEAVHHAHYYLFIWKNLSDPLYITAHILTVLLKILTIQVKDIRAITTAAVSIAKIVTYRRARSKPILSDEIILQRSRLLPSVKNESNSTSTFGQPTTSTTIADEAVLPN